MSMTDCRYMRTKYNYTPNDYDLYFERSDIPSNINYNGTIELAKIMRQYSPLSKKIHLNFKTYDKKSNVHVSLGTRLRVNEKEVDFK